jgi:hypothetical protein
VYNPIHPHEFDHGIPPIIMEDGHCAVCRALVRAEERGVEKGIATADRTPLWLLEGDLEWLEYAISDYIWRWGQHLPGVHPTSWAGTPTAVANMAMTVIRKSIRRIEPRPHIDRIDGETGP